MILLATCLSILANVPVDYKLVQNIYVIYNPETKRLYQIR